MPNPYNMTDEEWELIKYIVKSTGGSVTGVFDRAKEE